MAEIVKIQNQYFVEFYGNGLLFRKKAGTTEDDAKEMKQRIEESLAKEETDIFRVKEAGYDDFCAEFDAYSRHAYSKATYERLCRTIKDFSSFMQTRFSKERKMKELTPRMMEEYKADLIDRAKESDGKYKLHLVNLTLICLREVMTFAIKTAALNDNPVLHISFVNVQKRIPRVLTPEQIQQQFRNDKHTLQELAVFAIATGLRKDEITQLKWEAVHLNEQCLIAGDPARKIPMDPFVTDFFRRHEASANDQKLVFSIDAKNLPPVYNFNIFRNTFAQTLINKGLSLFQTANYLGLNDILPAMVYLPFFQEHHKSFPS